MRKNIVKQKWENGESIVNGWLHIGSGWTAEVMARTGFDSLTIDMQHGPVDFGQALEMLRGINTTETVPMARVPWNEPGIIMRLLDAGVYGIICPMINSREECEQFVGACRYHPEGYRSTGPTRVSLYAGSDYIENANQEILALAMIETAEAMENLEAITRVPGLSGVYVGPADLRLSLYGMGHKVGMDAPEFQEVLDRILAACKSAGIYAGIHVGSPEDGRKMLAKGFQLVTPMSDTTFLRQRAEEVVKIIRDEDKGKAGESIY